MKTPVLGSRFDKVVGLQAFTHIIHFFFIEHLRWLLLTVLPQYGKVSWGVCSFVPPRAFDFDQNLTQNVT